MLRLAVRRVVRVQRHTGRCGEFERAGVMLSMYDGIR